jgi:hypothetical protein
MKYRIQYIHKISPRPDDVLESVEIPDRAFAGSKELGKALREAGVLCKGERVRNMRCEAEKIIAFPAGRCIWHSIIITVQI